ncbi:MULTISPECIES: carbohydrate ABC transporter permease [Actinomyces]|uniref:Carbohydrate ABC transporter permease n=1 Tax=Actinomyces respiraculi TaxID=2744574 RepID=A0A7T0LJT2_9ACTO|nr:MULTISPECIES: carbohydrate ABC transporter permease [Actinomyces]QPL05074.1 carbohydrate ABC transporter permease [Actinomyces respiraculi]
MLKKKGGRRPNVLGGLLGWLWLLVAVVPIYYIIVTSLRSQADYYIENPLALPSNPTLRAYITVFENNFWMYFANSVLVTGATVAVVLVIAFMASYVIVRSRTRFSDRIFAMFLLGIAIPIQATIVPVYYLIVQMGLYDSLWAIILPSIAFAIPISVLILTNFLRDVPRELFESMKVDGATDWQMLWRLAAPLCKPALVTVGIYDALNVWNGFLFPLILTQSANKRVLPLSLWNFQGSFSSDTPAILAAVVLSALPLIVAYTLGRRQMVAGLTAGVGK